LLTLTLILSAVILIVLGYYVIWLIRKPSPTYREADLRLQPAMWRDDEVTVGWVGHSTLLINFYGYIILTDPVFGKRVGIRVGPKNWVVGIKRHIGPAISIEEIGKVDLILLSHAHMDHFDLPSLSKLANPETKVITPRNTSFLLKRMPFGQIIEIADQETIELDQRLKVTSICVRHWGSRFPWNIRFGYTGYLLQQKGVGIFFPGDTGFTPNFRQLREMGPVDIAAMPIGGYTPDSMQWSHCTPEQAWQMFIDTGAKWLIPIHFNTFSLSYEPVDEPLQRLIQAAGKEQDRIVIRKQGEKFTLKKV
jgi:L-ascorbate metabolism protein UlaG (beta-lactamase superfamily)